eukprot:CAMPEP_0202688804 /NCGR_PEP_ID=MMETSP1385-20130828/4227_1 /ASSEMBLY_ACC=CAM_ASM_000861 /TAXON_ID=933848 /ORGANISM="Elphidium margaritaceum" /LENGTH=1128 /DNA_ID=CAMNT_0049343849 /DNA_START=77 /DNA_END=3463 /DNA_ORIENTATION=+
MAEDDNDSDIENDSEASDQFQPEPLGGKNEEDFHSRNRSGTTVIKHRTKSSLGGQAELVNRMASRWGSMGDHDLDEVPNDDIDTDSDYGGDGDGNKKPSKKESKTPKNAENGAAAATDDAGGAQPAHRRKKSAADEINLLQSEREALENAFETYIDPEHNGDVDVDEWCIGLKKLDVDLSEVQQRKLYMFLDKDDTGFIEKNDFVLFATQRFDNEEILALQRPILEAVRIQNLHNRTHSNLMNSELATKDWNVYDMSILEQEMTSAMTTMVDVMKEQVDQEIEFKQEMENRLETNPDILKPENAFKWTPYEVVHWVEQMGMERYSRYFAQENVDGPMLLEDVNEELLTQQLGVRAIHAKKIMREIVGLKKAVRGETDLLLDESEFVCTHNLEDLQMKIAQLAIKEKLDKALKKIETMQKYYEEQIQQLTSGKKKKKKKKDKDKDNGTAAADASTSALTLPPGLSADDDSLLSPAFGMGVPVASSNSIITPNAEAGGGDDGDDNDENSAAADAEQTQEVKDADEATETETDSNTLLPALGDSRAQQSKSHDADVDDDDEDEESSDDDDDEDEDSGRRLLGMTPAQLMQLKSRGRGPSARQMARFLKDLRAKKQAMGDQFCIEDVDTIMEWSKEEVAYWIVSIDFEQYAFSFYSTPIDGDMLIRDMNQESIIEDLGVLKIHSARILRKIERLRRVINEGFDEDVDKTGITIEADVERPSKEQVDALQTQIEQLETERKTIMQELESKNENDEESGYFSTKIQELETQRNALQEEKEKLATDMEEVRTTHEQSVEDANNALSEANASNEELQKEIKSLKKEVRRAKRAANGDDDDAEESEEEESEAEEEAKIDDEEPIAITCTADEVEQQILQEMEENMEFGLAKNVLYWSPAEVCQWLKGLQFTPYVTMFYSAQIFGDVLLQDIGQRMLKKFNVTSMHIPKLLRCIEQLRNTAREQGVDIVLSEEVKNEMDPNYKPPGKEKKGKKAGKNGGGGGGKLVKELEQHLNEEKQRCEQLAQEVGQKDEQLSNFTEQFEEEKKMRTAIQFELEQLRDENEKMMDSVPAKQQIEELENMVSAIEENKMRTVRDLNSELHSLRVGCRLMQKEIVFLKKTQNKTMMDSFVGMLGYQAQ